MKNILNSILAISIVGIILCFVLGSLIFIIPIVIIILIITMFIRRDFIKIDASSFNNIKVDSNINDYDNTCTISINGKTYKTEGSSQSVVYKNGEIFINGKKANDKRLNVETIIINGNIDKLETDSSVNITGDVGSINAKGSVYCDNVKGSIYAGGSVNCDDVGGSIKAGGSVNSN